MLLVAVVVGTMGLSFVPQFEVFGVQTERVDILSELRAEPVAEIPFEYEADFERLAEELAVVETVVQSRDTLPIYRWIVAEVAPLKQKRLSPEALGYDQSAPIVPIENFYADSTASPLDSFLDKLLWGDDVRIAFMGDSFVEGDILSSDLRDGLQSCFGGRGVGFVHCDIPFATVRRTIKRTVKGWSSYSAMTPKKNPQGVNEQFFVSGYLAQGSAGATATWQSTKAFATLDSCCRSRILLLSREDSRVEITLNGDTALRRTFDIRANLLPQQIYIEAPVKDIKMRVVEGNISCYGASLEGNGGVTVDNLSMRSNSGHAIFGTNAAVNRQIDTMLDYDVVVLQYGLNIMEAGKRNYAAYRDKLREIVSYAQKCFPRAAILLLGVSDRWVKNSESGEYEPIGSVDALTSYQRAAADSCGVAFWPISQAMALDGGMPAYTRNGWASADHTHINFAGGRRVAQHLTTAIKADAYYRIVNGIARVPASAVAEPKEITKSTTIEQKPVSWGVDTPAKPNPTVEEPILEESAVAEPTPEEPAVAEPILEESVAEKGEVIEVSDDEEQFFETT